MTRHVRLKPPIFVITGTFGGYGGYGVLDMVDPDQRAEEEEVSLEVEPLNPSHPVPRIPISYEDLDDYAPFDDDIGSKESQ